MAQSCKICASGARDDVNSDLMRGQSVRDVARKYGFSRAGTHRHSLKCLPQALAAHSVLGQNIGDELASLWKEAERLKRAAENSGDLRAALIGLRQLCDLLELKMRAIPSNLRGVQQAVEFHVTYDSRPREDTVLSDDQILQQLGLLIRRTKSEPVMACAARLALLLKNRVIPAELDAQLAKVEAGVPQLPDGGNNADLA